MSVPMGARVDDGEHDDETNDPDGGTAPGLAATPVVVRRNAALAAAVGAAASAIAIAYLWRAVQGGAPLDWVVCVLVAVVAGFHLSGLLDARTPLVVADEMGVRIRLGAQWRGLPWDAVAAVEVQPRRGLLGDGRLAFRPHSLERALDGLEARGRRSAAVNQRLYGAPLAVPIGLTTRTSASPESLADDLVGLAQERANVEVLTPEPPVEPVETPEPEPPVDLVETQRRSLLGGLGTIVSRVAKGRDHDVDADDSKVRAADTAVVTTEESEERGEPVVPPALAVPLRDTRRGLRAEVTRDEPATSLGAVALHQDAVEAKPGLPESRELHRPGSVDLVFESTVRPISRLADPVAPLVIDDLGAEPADDPVIGPDLAAARTRVGLSVDELAERTRIRPHVIESIEVDDFAPCGGDFYARGHLRTLARVLGQDPGPLLERFDNRYATAPVNARRVFEAELATGMTGSMRSTVGGPNWGLLVGVVLTLVLVWGVVRLFATEPPEVGSGLLPGAAPVLNGSAGVDREFPEARGGRSGTHGGGRPLPVTLVATQAGSRVLVRDGRGKVVHAGEMVVGERKTLKVDPPVRVQARNAGAIEVRIKGQDRGPVGELGKPGRRTFQRPTR